MVEGLGVAVSWTAADGASPRNAMDLAELTFRVEDLHGVEHCLVEQAIAHSRHGRSVEVGPDQGFGSSIRFVR